ncbi:MAG TPA: helix-hairpin-helix domain-containing protein, partial [Gemmatimonadota bacterium]|nr:helix-hairpin-helix domain-containing protein [Gemmatimonadota bacterium]
GPARARAIIGWREENGRFRNFRDLMEVPGIGPALVSKLRSLTVIRP